MGLPVGPAPGQGHDVHRDVIVVGGSAGAMSPLREIVAKLDANLPAAVFVVLHIAPFTDSALPALLNRWGPLPAAHACDGEPVRRGRIYVGPPDRHLLLDDGRLRLTRGPRENRQRPAIDALFRSAVAAYGPRVIGVVLSGNLDDGSVGLLAVKRAGGIAVVQADPEYEAMPQNAMNVAPADHVVGCAEIGPTLNRVVEQPLSSRDGALPQPTPAIDRIDDAPAQAAELQASPSGFSCPDCGGVLSTVEEEPLRFRCRVGHAFGPQNLLASQTDALEGALWAAQRALEERAELLDRLAARFDDRGSPRQAARFADDAAATQQRADLVRRTLLDEDLIGREPPLPTSGLSDAEPSGQARLSS